MMSKEQDQHDAEIDLIIDKLIDCLAGHDATNAAIATGTVMARLMFIEKTSPSDMVQFISGVYSQLEEADSSAKH